MSASNSGFDMPEPSAIQLHYVAHTASETSADTGEVNAGIESSHSQQFSMAIFAFMMLAIIIFTGIVLGFMRGKTGNPLKTGEKWLFAWIFVGILVSIGFGALQLLGGYLF